MRLSLSRTLGLAAFVTGVVVVGVAHAQSFDTATFVPLTRGGAVVGDAIGPGTGDTDIVGSAALPAVFVSSDATDLYIRLRVNAKPTVANGTFDLAYWGCLVDTNGTLTNYELMAVVDGPHDEVQWRYNAVQSVGANVPNEPAEVLVGTSPAADNARAIDAMSATPFSATPDWFVDIAVPWATIRAGGNGAPGVALGAPMRFACGTATNGFHIGTDQATTDAAGALTGTWSDPYVCTDAGCALDTDGDGVPDAVETTFGTSPTKVDTDGDGIADNVELSSGAGPFGPYTGPDTDGDGTNDALDVDSDNDCRPDSLDGVVGFRNASAPNANPSSNCSGTKPVCKATTGTCVACDASRNSPGMAVCPFASAPSCQLTGAIAGSCTACNAAETDLCTTIAPACDATTGACAACNGDHNAPTTAVCPSALFPVCNVVGGLAGTCTQCTSKKTTLCTTATPACDVTSGTCAACNGDRGGGSTHACPAAASPYCVLSGATMGECGKCTSNADCTGMHTGPTCDVASGSCTDKDTDGDGLNDTVERLLGTDPMKADSDNDGIDDLTEVTPPGGGPSEKVDSDNDGTIDALDLDSDNDGLTDSAEGKTDPDGDGLASFRDADDDGDGIPTKAEIADATAAGVGDDVDGDALKNYYDTDADGDGKPDAVEGRGDQDKDGIPDYLDNDKSRPDAGPVITPVSDDAGVHEMAAADDGVLEGTGLLCAVSEVSGQRGASWAVIVGLLGAVLAAAGRSRRTRKR